MKRQLNPTAEKPFFCFDGDEHEYFATEEEALKASEAAIAYYLDEFWDEQVDTVMIGKVTHLATKTNYRKRPEAEELDEEGIDGSGECWGDEAYKCDYVATLLDRTE